MLQMRAVWSVPCASLLLPSVPRAQDIEPRTYSNAPNGVNYLILSYGYTRGGLAFDSAAPSRIRSSAAACARDRSGRSDDPVSDSVCFNL